MTRDDADAFQDWAAMDGDQAFLLIERHADGFQVAHELMEAWARARVKEEREACREVLEECIRTQAHLACNAREAPSEASARIYKRGDA